LRLGPGEALPIWSRSRAGSTAKVSRLPDQYGSGLLHTNTLCFSAGGDYQDFMFSLCLDLLAKALSLQRPPRHVTTQVLPETLQPPDHVRLAVWKVFEKTIAHKPGYILPVVVALVGQLFLQDGADQRSRLRMHIRTSGIAQRIRGSAPQATPPRQLSRYQAVR
jgi:hypothetical protein